MLAARLTVIGTATDSSSAEIKGSSGARKVNFDERMAGSHGSTGVEGAAVGRSTAQATV
jgi:hypothetical protein